MQGGAPGTHPQDGCRCEAYLVRTPQRRASAPTPQMGLFQQPANADTPTAPSGRIEPHPLGHGRSVGLHPVQHGTQTGEMVLFFVPEDHQQRLAASSRFAFRQTRKELLRIVRLRRHGGTQAAILASRYSGSGAAAPWREVRSDVASGRSFRPTRPSDRRANERPPEGSSSANWLLQTPSLRDTAHAQAAAGELGVGSPRAIARITMTSLSLLGATLPISPPHASRIPKASIADALRSSKTIRIPDTGLENEQSGRRANPGGDASRPTVPANCDFSVCRTVHRLLRSLGVRHECSKAHEGVPTDHSVCAKTRRRSTVGGYLRGKLVDLRVSPGRSRLCHPLLTSDR